MTPGRGRPVRFLAVVTAGWVGMRVILLLPETVEVVTREAAALSAPRAIAAPTVADRRPLSTIGPRSYSHIYPQLAAVRPRHSATGSVELAIALPIEPGTAASVDPDTNTPVMPRPDLPPGIARPGLTGSAWVALRGGAATGGPVQLGGGQAGIRLRMPVTANNRVALVGRVAAPLAGQGSEAAFGVEWRPGGGAVALVAERRVALDSGGDGTGLGVIAGLDRAIGERIVIEGYGQAGMVLRKTRQPYADGAARILYKLGNGRIRVGVGSWGAAQREGARLDLGPSAVAALPMGRQSFRLSLDWRQRVAGNAAPGSGVALTLGSDF